MSELKISIENKIKGIYDIILMTKEFQKFSKHFHTFASKEESYLLLKSPHSKALQFLGHSLYRNTIIEIAKLFSNNKGDRYSIKNLLNTLNNNHKQLSLDITVLIPPLEFINNNQELLGNIKLLRDKIYAHSDKPNTSLEELEVSLNDIDYLIDFCERTLNSIYISISNNDFSFLSPITGSKDLNLLSLLVEGESQRLNKIKEEILSKYSQH
ncbi:hypothetical protein [Myroides odoratimimus]|uniref:AbiU2 domain-containing protein n=1 Tax=Myroides odoratimimus TaxID=76832 RepID=UPI0025769F35|nr:hypothetical protein [Myroides odoratimimus]MDM1529013.1 hypothetical protein [Myroides odoratimimus]